MKSRKLLLLPLALAAMLASCSKQNDVEPLGVEPLGVEPLSVVTMSAATVSTGTSGETFEAGTKTSYANANVTLASGSWAFNNALIGTSTSDRKTGSRSARIQGTGSIAMNFDAATGASTVTVKHARYGSDASSTWQLLVSTDGGSTYTQVGSTITSSSTTLSTATFTVNKNGKLRFKVLKLTGTGSINIDEFTVNK